MRQGGLGLGASDLAGAARRYGEAVTPSQLTVLVTGATSGIGEEVARQFASAGHRVFGTSRHPDKVADPIPGVTYVRLDNADYESATECAH